MLLYTFSIFQIAKCKVSLENSQPWQAGTSVHSYISGQTISIWKIAHHLNVREYLVKINVCDELCAIQMMKSKITKKVLLLKSCFQNSWQIPMSSSNAMTKIF